LKLYFNKETFLNPRYVNEAEKVGNQITNISSTRHMILLTNIVKQIQWLYNTFANKSGLSVRSTVLYCGVRRFLQGSETWIRIGSEFDSNFSVKATFRPNKQYLESIRCFIGLSW